MDRIQAGGWDHPCFKAREVLEEGCQDLGGAVPHVTYLVSACVNSSIKYDFCEGVWVALSIQVRVTKRVCWRSLSPFWAKKHDGEEGVKPS